MNMQDRLYRFGVIEGDGPEFRSREFLYPDVFLEEPANHPAIRRLKVGAADPLKVFRRLAKELVPPVDVLYLLHTSRCDQPLGRYQSPPLDGPDLADFFNEFGEYLSGDGRHEVWLHSRRALLSAGGSKADAMKADATLVWHRDNLIYAYGPLARFREILRELNLSESPVHIPHPHSHHYHEEFDGEEIRLLAYLDWTRTPLAVADRAFPPTAPPALPAR